MPNKKGTIYVLWDENDGYRMNRVYLDKPSAQIGLEEHYTDYWISTQKAKIEEVPVISYRKY